jgi:imidazolonepropionase-like amidohydrolase
VIKDVRLEVAPDAPRVSIVLRNGRIERVLEAGAQLPIGTREVDGKGNLALPAFLDAYSRAGCETPAPVADKDAPPPQVSDVQVDMREANRKGIQPAFRAAEVFDLPKDESKKWREAGFGALLTSPADQLLAGTSALATTRQAAMRDTIVVPDVFMHAAFQASGSGYPSTQMGFAAQLRQFFLDAERHAELVARYEARRPGPRPPFDAELEAGLPLVAKSRRVACQANTVQDIRRWIALADELGLEIAIVGGREAWKIADVLGARRIPVILTLEWGDEPKDPHEKEKKPMKERKPEAAQPEGEKPPEAAPEAKPDDEKKKADEEKKRWEYEEPLGVREWKRREWEEGRDCAIALAKAGVPFAFGSGSSSATELLKRVRTLVENGLTPEAAQAALTTTAASFLGVADRLGAIEAGADATLALWTAHPTAKDAKLAWLFVDGFAHEFELEKSAAPEGKPDEGVDASGTWSVSIESDQGSRKGTLELSMKPDGEASGTLTTTTPNGDELVIEYAGYVRGKTMTLEGSYTRRDLEIKSTWKVELAGDSLSGTATTKGPWGETDSRVEGTRTPKGGEIER